MPLMSLQRVKQSLIGSVVTLCGCTVIGMNQAPIQDRSAPPRNASSASAPSVTTATNATPSRATPGYTVQRGDTLYSIALAHNLDVRDLARWNGVDDASRLRIGQVLRVSPAPGEAAPEMAAAPVVDAPVVIGSSIESRPLEGAPLGAAPGMADPAPVLTPTPSSASSAPALPATATPATNANSAWIWPVQGKVVTPFNEARSKGIDIAGKEGDAVVAVQDGQVVYSGNSLRGYGNLVIIKHSDDFVSAYAHNKNNVAQHGQTVKRGQRIAEMGRTEAYATPTLHFEMRREGKPVDPAQYLPAPSLTAR